MANRSYRIGYNFELRVKRHLEKKGWLVFRQGKSKFPDLICIRVYAETFNTTKITHPQVMLVECKVNKYLSKKESEEFKKLKEIGLKCRVYWRDSRKLKEYDI